MPHTVQLAPYLVESVCELTRAVRDKAYAQTEVSGLLFGRSEPGVTVVEALKNFKDSGPRSDLARRERLDRAFAVATAEAAQDPELNAMKLVGWFSLRGSSGLLTSDIDFHNRHFKTSEDLALVIWREADTQAIAEVYSKGEDTRLTSEDFRWSSVRLSTEMRRVTEPIDLAMRVKLSEDSYLKTYQTTASERRAEWKDMAESARQSLLSFLPGRRTSDSPNNTGSQVEQTAPTASQQGSNASLLRRAGEPAKSYPVTSLAAAESVREPSRIVEPESAFIPATRGARRDHPEEVSGLPMVISNTRKRRSMLPLVSTGLVFLFFSAITFAILAMTGSGSGTGKISQIMRILFPGTDLGLRVDSQGEKLLVSWNRRNPTVASASDGTLLIFDGADRRTVSLNAEQVANGAVLYKPVTNDVTFRLEVHGTDQSTVMGSQRLLDATRITASAHSDQPLDLSNKSSTPPAQPKTSQAAANKPAPAPNTRRPVLYRNSENGRVSVPVPLPTQPPQEAAAKTPVETPTTAPTNNPPPASGAAPQASNPPASTPNLQAPANPGSTINGWDREHEETPPDARTSAFIAPQPVLQVLPNTKTLPPASFTQVRRVSVEVKIDTTGHVTSAHIVNDGGAANDLSNAALTAAKQWTFQPATLRGEKIASEHTILFEFRPGPLNPE
jgi:TonB family protein